MPSLKATAVKKDFFVTADEFLQKAAKMPRTMLRYAIGKLDKKEKACYMGLK